MQYFTRNPFVSPRLGDLFVIGDELDPDNDWKIHEIRFNDKGTPTDVVLYNGKRWKTRMWVWMRFMFWANKVKCIRNGETTVWRSPWLHPERGDIFRSFDQKIEVLTTLSIPHYEGTRIAFAWRGVTSDDVPVSPETRVAMMQNRGAYRHEEFSLAEFRERVKNMQHVAEEGKE